MDCDPGHVPPAWTANAIAALSPVSNRCVSTATVPKSSDPSRGWYICGGLFAPAGQTFAVPTVCPSAPGGFGVGFGVQPSDWYSEADTTSAVVLDCPGRYDVSRPDPNGPIAITLSDPGPDACGIKGADELAVKGAWGFFAEGASLVDRMDTLPGLAPLLPATLRSGWAADLDTWREGLDGNAAAMTLVWQGGRADLRVGALSVLAGWDVEWNNVRAYGEAGPGGSYIELWDLPIRLMVPRAIGRVDSGGRLALDTYARVRLDDHGGDLVDAIAVRLPEAKVCKVELPAGQSARLSAAPASGRRPRCKRTPPSAPQDLTFGAGWAELGWNHDPYNDQVPSAGDDEDPGCVVRCAAR